MGKFYKKDKSYLEELSKKLRRDKKYINFCNELNIDPEDINTLGKYLLKLSIELPEPTKPRKDTPQDREEHIDMLEKTGEFLKDTTKLEEVKKEYNTAVLRNTEEFAGGIGKNPFILTKKQLEAEFLRERNEKLPDVELDIKSCQWENKVVKTVEGIRNAYLDNYVKEKDIDEQEFKRKVMNDFSNNIFKSKCKCLDKYKDYISGKITRGELEKSKEYKEAKGILRNISKNVYKSPNKIDIDFVLENKLFCSTIDSRYRYKDIYVQRTITRTKEEPDKVKFGIYNERNAENNKNFAPCGFSVEGYNMEAMVHVEKKEYNKLKDKVSPDFEGVFCEFTYLPGTVFYKYTEEQQERIEELANERRNLKPEQKKVLDFLVRAKDMTQKDRYMNRLMAAQKNIDDMADNLKENSNYDKKPKDSDERGER